MTISTSSPVADRTSDDLGHRFAILTLSEAGLVWHVREDERRLIARELHDSTSQNLMGIGLLLAKALRRNWENSEISQALEEASRLIAETLKEVRCLTYLLSPPAVEEYGFIEAMRQCVAGFERLTGLQVKFICRVDEDRLMLLHKNALYRILQEALSNVNHHAKAQSVSICLFSTESMLRLSVSDDGLGFPDPASPASGAGSFGLETMRSRAEELGGYLRLTSSRTGTKVRATFPLCRPAIGQGETGR